MTISRSAPVVVQSMTNTDTADVDATASQAIELFDAGSQIVRITVNTEAAAQAVPKIKERLAAMGYDIPLVGCFHYNGHILLAKYPECAAALDKYRINPGNVGFKDKRDTNFEQIIKIAIKNKKPIRIGVNWGSVDQQLAEHLMDENSKKEVPGDSDTVMLDILIQSALNSARFAESIGMPSDAIIISAKVSKPKLLIPLYRKLYKECAYPLHLGLTEAGQGMKGIVSSTAALAPLLLEGIGDTIRVSLTPAPGESRVREVLACKHILQSLDLVRFTPDITSCPGCGRTTSTYFQKLANDITQYVESNMPVWKIEHPGVENMNIAVMGCVVNGPGESKHANIGISLPGTGEAPAAPVYVDGKHVETLRGDDITAQFKAIISKYINTNYSSEKASCDLAS